MANEKSSLSITRLAAVVRRHWLAILGAGVVFAAVAGGWSIAFPPAYEATASVLITRSDREVRIEDRFLTTSQEPTSPADMRARRQVLFELSKAPAVAEEVFLRMKDQLDPSIENPSALTRRVRTSMPGHADLIRISFQSQDADLAAEGANTWANEYIRHVNETYDEAALSLEAVRDRMPEAVEAHRQAQEELEQFLLESPAAELRRRLADSEEAIETLRADTPWTTALTAPVRADVVALEDLYDLLRRIDLITEHAAGMRLQISTGEAPAAASNAPAIRLLKAQAFAAAPSLQGGLRLDAGTPSEQSAVEMIADLDALISALQQRREKTLSRIDELSAKLLGAADESDDTDGDAPETPPILADGLPPGPHAEAIARIEADARKLRRQLEQQQAARAELTRQRDRAADILDMLKTKQAELEISRDAMGSEARLASTATVPSKRTGSQAMAAVFAGAGGLLAGLIVSLLRDRA